MASVPILSVLMAVYNAERYVAEAVESILAQTFRDFEFLIIDDGSTDNSGAILRRYAERDPRIRLISRGNTGQAAARNELLDLAQGEFVAIMDADDIALPERFDCQLAFLLGNPDCVLVGCHALVVDSDGDPICVWFQGQTHEELDTQNLHGELGSSLCHPSVMMRRQTVLEIGKYRERSLCEDLDLCLRMAEHGRLANLPQVLLKYRQHQTNDSRRRVARANEDYQQVLREARQRRGLLVGELPLRFPVGERPCHQSTHQIQAWQALMGGHVATARKHARRSLIEAPFSMNAWKLLYCALRGH